VVVADVGDEQRRPALLVLPIAMPSQSRAPAPASVSVASVRPSGPIAKIWGAPPESLWV